MDSVDRATLIDFALGRLDDAEAAALARRAERDSEFAQTLASLRRELASLDAVCPAALRARPLRSPSSALETSPDDAPSNIDDENRVVYLDSPPANAVKVRRVGPVYPYYADETGEEDEAAPINEIGETSEVAPISEIGEESKAAPISEIGETSEVAPISEIGEMNEVAPISEIGETNAVVPISEIGETNEVAPIDEIGETNAVAPISEIGETNEVVPIGETGEEDEIAPISENGQENEAAPISENGEEDEIAPIGETGEEDEAAPISENGETGQNVESALAAPTSSSPRRARFIPKFVAAPRSSQRSSFVAKRARFLDDASPLNAVVSDLDASSRPVEFQGFQDVANDETPRAADFENAESADERVDEPKENVAKSDDANVEVRRDPSPSVAPFGESPNAPSENAQSVDEPKENVAKSDDADVEVRRDPSPNVAPFGESPNAPSENAQSDDESKENVAKSDDERGNEQKENVAKPDAADAADAADEERFEETRVEPDVDATRRAQLSNEERRLVELLGREPTPTEKDEYYWETVVDEPDDDRLPKKRGALLGAPTRFAMETTIAVGRTTLALCGANRRGALGSDAFAATKPRRRRQQSKISDMMISTVFGFLIAVVVVWPLICYAAQELLATIARSAVSKFGVNVPVSEQTPQSAVFPLISEHMVFPSYSESNALRTLGAKSLPQPGEVSETSATDADANDDPASTQPTLVPAPVDADEPTTFLPAPVDASEPTTFLPVPTDAGEPTTFLPVPVDVDAAYGASVDAEEPTPLVSPR